MAEHITASARAYDGHVKYTWPLTLMHQDDDFMALKGEAGRPVWHGRHGLVHVEFGSIEFYWKDRWYTVGISHDEAGSVQLWYCNVCLPPVRFESRSLSFIDLELDVIVEPDLSIRVADEEEFMAAVSRYQIPEPVVERARLTIDHLASLVCARAWPFDSTRIDRLWPPGLEAV